jgi:hypothetical protein
MGITEDQLANSIIKNHRMLSELWFNDFDAYPEAHYNHYGNRGVADLYIIEENKHGPNGNGDLYELKSEYAIKETTGANAIIRQFNKMREFFFKGSSHNLPRDNLRFTLAFAGTPHNLQHIYDNREMYKSAVNQSFYQDEPVDEESMIQLNDPEELGAVTLISGNSGDTIAPMTQGEEFIPYVEEQNQAVFDRCESVIRRIVEEA